MVRFSQNIKGPKCTFPRGGAMGPLAPPLPPASVGHPLLVFYILHIFVFLHCFLIKVQQLIMTILFKKSTQTY